MSCNHEWLFSKLKAYAYAVPWNENPLVPYPLHQGHFICEEGGFTVITKETYNDFVVRYVDRIIGMLRKEDDPLSSAFYCWLSKPYRLQFLDLIKEDITPEKLGELLSWVWVQTEFPNQNGVDRWIKLFQRVCRSTLMTSEELEKYNDLPDKVVVYRGLQSDKTKVRGMSWTLSIDKAKWFACRWQRVGEVYSAIIRKDGIFAYLNGRGEEEVVVNSRRLKEIQPVYIKEEKN